MPSPEPHKSTFTYRPDIDGLRALAVLAVLACHMEVHHFAGGFVGVDVFFVISGYLISSIVFADIAASRFSVLAFYERRIRRIFPALFVMLLVFSAFAAVYFLPAELVTFGKSLLAATLSVSNVYLAQHSGYFDSPTSNPLLHTWSLAVEEQFYLLFPIFLLLVRKLARRSTPRLLKPAVITLCLLSFLASVLIVAHSRTLAFYMPYTRAWELLLGTLLSLKMFPRLSSASLRNLATLTGLAMIAFAVFTFSAATLFPGVSALLPCIGSALIIYAGESGPSLVASVLSLRPVVFTGLISYSLYLWHWPVIILHKMGVLFDINSTLPHRFANRISPQHFDILIELVTSLALAVLSWRFVERPFRLGPLRLKGRPLFTLAGATLAVFTLASLTVMASGGFARRFSPQSNHLASFLTSTDEVASMRLGTCFLTSGSLATDYNYNLCLHQDPARKNYLLLGDSHSAMLWSGLSSALPSANILQTSISGCEPVLQPTGSPLCRQMMHYIFATWLPQHPIQALLLQAHWEPNQLPQLAQTLTWANAHHIPVILFGPVPEYDAPLPRLEAYAAAWNQPSLPARHRLPSIEPLDRTLQHLAATTWQVPYVSLYQAICSSTTCTEFTDPAHTIPLMFDTNHLSAAGSRLVVDRLIAHGNFPLPAD